MPLRTTGPVCVRHGCRRPTWKDDLCSACWRLGTLFRKDPELFAYEPLHGYADERDAVALPWERLERAAAAQGLTPAEALRRLPRAD